MKAYNLEIALKYPQDVTHLYLHKRHFRTLPEQIRCFANLKYLEVSASSLQSLPDWLMELRQLESLIVPANQIRTLPKGLMLMALDLSGNALSNLPESLWQMTDLIQLKLADNQLSCLPEHMARLKSLQVLDISGNELQSLPSALVNCRALRQLNCGHNSLRSLPAALYACTNLERLDVSHNLLRELASGIWPQLRKLDISNNKLQAIPTAILNSTRLRQLNLSSNKIGQLTEKLEQLDQLRALDLSANQLDSLPEEVRHLKELQSLSVQKNRLQQLPKKLIHLEKLEELNISNNPIRELPTGLHQLKRLRKLVAIRTHISVFPKVLLQLDSLVQLKGLSRSVPCAKLLRFLKVCRKAAIAPPLRPALFGLLIRNKAEMGRLSEEELFQAMHFPLKAVRDAARHQLCKSSQAIELDKPQQVYIAGKLLGSKASWQEKLSAQGHQLTGEWSSSASLILLGDQPKEVELLSESKVPFVDEQALQGLLNQSHTQPPFEGRQLQNLSGLLLSKNDANRWIAVRILESGSGAQFLLSEIFIAWKSVRQARLKRALHTLLELHADSATRKVFPLKLKLKGQLNDRQLASSIQQFCDGTQLDSDKLTKFFREKPPSSTDDKSSRAGFAANATHPHWHTWH